MDRECYRQEMTLTYEYPYGIVHYGHKFDFPARHKTEVALTTELDRINSLLQHNIHDNEDFQILSYI